MTERRRWAVAVELLAALVTKQPLASPRPAAIRAEARPEPEVKPASLAWETAASRGVTASTTTATASSTMDFRSSPNPGPSRSEAIRGAPTWGSTSTATRAVGLGTRSWSKPRTGSPCSGSWASGAAASSPAPSTGGSPVISSPWATCRRWVPSTGWERCGAALLRPPGPSCCSLNASATLTCRAFLSLTGNCP
jgi:hypothetical protein